MSGLTPFGEGVTERLTDSAALFAERAAVYKDNYRAVGRVMEALFPDGHTQMSQDDHNRWHLFELLIVKLTRYAQNYDSGGHADSADDSIVYWAMLAQLDHELGEDIPEPFEEPPTSPVATSVGAVVDQGSAETEGWRLQPHILRTEDNQIMTASWPDGTLFKVGKRVRFKQHLGRGSALEIVAIDPNHEDGLAIGLSVGEGVTQWTHPAWLDTV